MRPICWLKLVAKLYQRVTRKISGGIALARGRAKDTFFWFKRMSSSEVLPRRSVDTFDFHLLAMSRQLIVTSCVNVSHGLHVWSNQPWSRRMSAREYKFWHFLVIGNPTCTSLDFYYFLLTQDIVGGQVHEFQVHRPFDTPRSYQLKIGDEAIEAPMVCAKHSLAWSGIPIGFTKRLSDHILSVLHSSATSVICLPSAFSSFFRVRWPNSWTRRQKGGMRVTGFGRDDIFSCALTCSRHLKPSHLTPFWFSRN